MANNSKPSQLILVDQGHGFLNGLVSDFARMLDEQLASSSALGCPNLPTAATAPLTKP